jgi:hypothetical protein
MRLLQPLFLPYATTDNPLLNPMVRVHPPLVQEQPLRPTIRPFDKSSHFKEPSPRPLHHTALSVTVGVIHR